MAYSKSAYAKQLGIGKKDLEKKARKAGYDTTEGYYNAQQGGGGDSGGGYQNVINKQREEEEALFKQFQEKLAAQPSAEDIFNRIGGEYDLDPKRAMASQLGEEYRGIAPETTTYGKNFGMSSSQIAKRVQALQDRMAPRYEEAQRSFGTALGGVQEKAGLAYQDLQKQLTPFTERFSFLKERAGREMTGYTEQARRSLDTTLEKLRQGNQMGMEELKAAAEVAKAEKANLEWTRRYDYERNNPKKLAGVDETGW